MLNILKYLPFDKCKMGYNTINSEQRARRGTSGQFQIFDCNGRRETNSKEIYRGINYFQSKGNLTRTELIELADFCRSIIATQANWVPFSQMVNPDNIPFYSNIKKDSAFEFLLFSFGVTEKIVQQIKDDFLRLLSIYISPIGWDNFIKFIRHRYPDNIFSSFTFEDSLFLIYNCEKLYNHLGYFSRLIFDYDDNVLFYAKCLAGAIKTFMKTLRIEPTGKYKTRENHSISEQIFYEFLESYIEIQNNSGNIYFKSINPITDKKKVD